MEKLRARAKSLELGVSPANWVEITNPVHGGPGWSFGSCLWSPIYNKAGNQSWAIMQGLKPGDRVYHFLKTKVGNRSEYQFVGRSLVEERAEIIEIEPPQADRWSKMSPYYRVPLTAYTPNVRRVPAAALFQTYETEFRKALASNPHSQFFVEYGNSGDLRMAQAYLRELPISLAEVLDEASGTDFTGIHRESDTTENEPAYADRAAPGTVTTTITRKIRDTALTRRLKQKFGWRCAVCGKRITLPGGNFYAEAHHIRPLGGGHEGLDREDNIIILCPYHHAEFDYGSIAIHPDSLVIIHINSESNFHGLTPFYSLEYVANESLRYHTRLHGLTA